MKVAIITDTHYGARKGSKYLHDYFELFYDNIFFPALEKHGVEAVIHMGDAFDSRKSIDYQSLEWAKRVVFEPLRNYEVHMVIGNHDCYYKNTNNVNSPSLLLKDYPNVKTYSSPQTIKVGGLDIMMVPWICSENYDETLNHIEKTKAKIAMGHLEFQGFRVNRNLVMEDHGLDSTIFSKFKKVITVEDGCLMGGFGSAVLEFMVDQKYAAEIIRLGIPDEYIHHGTQEELWADCGFNKGAIVKTVSKMLSIQKQTKVAETKVG
jgi:predicted phosphodiesterase